MEASSLCTRHRPTVKCQFSPALSEHCLQGFIAGNVGRGVSGDNVQEGPVALTKDSVQQKILQRCRKTRNAEPESQWEVRQADTGADASPDEVAEQRHVIRRK